MKTFQANFSTIQEADIFSESAISFVPNLILLFGGREFLGSTSLIKKLKGEFPDAILSGCSTSGEILGTSVNDNTLCMTAVRFEKTKLVCNQERIVASGDGKLTGKALAQRLVSENLRHVFVLSEGLGINGSELVRGMSDNLPDGVSVTGGLAGDGADFLETLVISQTGEARSDIVVAIGFYGEDIKIGYGSFGGWDSFGVERSVTKSKANVVYEIDNTPALGLYKSFLGTQAETLPASGLLFPLNMRTQTDGKPVVRTILAIDEQEQSLTFAGDIPEGSYVKLMKANNDRLISGAEEAARVSLQPLLESKAELAILISCVGRKLVLKQLVEEEVEAVGEIVGPQAVVTGFYSYGEIAPFLEGARCELHNQTMTITTFSEV
jgi:hypothetical protein